MKNQVETPALEEKASSPTTMFLINRNYSLLWSGQTISVIGDYLFNTTLTLWVATSIARGQSWGPLAVSGTLAMAAIPMVLISPIGGVFADRWNRRTIMLWMDIIRALLIMSLLLFAGIGPFPLLSHVSNIMQLVVIYVIVFCAGICTQFFNPARFAFLGEIVPAPQITQASSLSQVSLNLALIFGPILATTLFFAVGIQWALAINALSFVASYITILLICLQAQERTPSKTTIRTFFNEFSQGLRFCFQNPILQTLIVSILICNLGLGAVNALNIFFVTQNLHAPASLYGILIAASGVGSVLGAVLASIYSQRTGQLRIVWGGLLATGVLFLILARLTSFWPALAFSFLLGLPVTAINTVMVPIIFRVTPPQFIGRVISIITPCMAFITIISTSLAGFLSSTVLHGFHAMIIGFAFGPIDTIFTATGLLVLIGGIFALLKFRHQSLNQ